VGAPVNNAEVQVPLRKRIVRLVVVEKDGVNPTMDFPIEEEMSVQEAAESLIKAGIVTGLLPPHGTIRAVDTDALSRDAHFKGGGNDAPPEKRKLNTEGRNYERP
jgi:hypothetical protein